MTFQPHVIETNKRRINNEGRLINNRLCVKKDKKEVRVGHPINGKRSGLVGSTKFIYCPLVCLLILMSVCTCLFTCEPEHEIGRVRVFSRCVKILPIWWQARGMVLMTQVAPPNSSAKPKNSFSLNAASPQIQSSTIVLLTLKERERTGEGRRERQREYDTDWERERAICLSSCLTVSLCEECVTTRWKTVKKRGKIKERKGKKESEGVVGRGTVTRGDYGVQETSALYVCVLCGSALDGWLCNHVMYARLRF